MTDLLEQAERNLKAANENYIRACSYFEAGISDLKLHIKLQSDKAPAEKPCVFIHMPPDEFDFKINWKNEGLALLCCIFSALIIFCIVDFILSY